MLIMITARTQREGQVFAATTEPVASEKLRIYDVGFRVASQDRHKGVSWVGNRPVGAKHIMPLTSLGADWMVQTPFGWQPHHNDPELRLSNHGHLWGEADEGLISTNKMACNLDIKVLLKPHIWLTRSNDGKWRKDIAMVSEQDWQAWFANYRTFILHYARLAQEQDMAGLCIGTELAGTVEREGEWRALIAEIRSLYSGKLTYAANWHDEFERVPFWDALDWIGIQAYFPLSKSPSASVDELIEGWQPHLVKMAEVARRTQKPVIITEMGYRATPDAAIEPWLWPERGLKASPEGLVMQARCYEAYFKAVWNQPWLLGTYIWKWHPSMGLAEPPRELNIGFSPQHKPALEVLRRYYNGHN